jgi:hypothetical protein
MKSASTLASSTFFQFIAFTPFWRATIARRRVVGPKRVPLGVVRLGGRGGGPDLGTTLPPGTGVAAMQRRLPRDAASIARPAATARQSRRAAGSGVAARPQR